MLTDISPPPVITDTPEGVAPDSLVQRLIGRISRLEIVVGAVIAAVMLLLVIIEPSILEAPFENARTLLFTGGGTAVAAIAVLVMLLLRVPPAARVLVLLVPFVIVNWWLLSPYFIDEVVDESFSTSISDQLGSSGAPAGPVAPAPGADAASTEASTPSQADESAPAVDEDQSASSDVATADDQTTDEQATPTEPEPAEDQVATPPAPSGPVLLGAGQFVGLAGHRGTGDAGIFENPDGTLTLRFENFDIENGPDLEVYLVPGADQTSLPAGSIALGALKGNIGDQNYELPPGTELAPGSYTALVWCEAFGVEFVGATVNV